MDMFQDVRIRIFLSVVEEGGFTAAAKRLGISQPAVSQNISELEKALSVKLFRRRKGGVDLTLEGEVFLSCARKLDSMYSAVGAVFFDDTATWTERPLVLAAAPSLPSGLIESIVSPFTEFVPVEVKTVTLQVGSDDDPSADAVFLTDKGGDLDDDCFVAGHLESTCRSASGRDRMDYSRIVCHMKKEFALTSLGKLFSETLSLSR